MTKILKIELNIICDVDQTLIILILIPLTLISFVRLRTLVEDDVGSKRSEVKNMAAVRVWLRCVTVWDELN